MNIQIQEIKLSIKTTSHNLNNNLSSHIGKINNLTKYFSTDASAI
jgi:hypothetical protein